MSENTKKVAVKLSLPLPYQQEIFQQIRDRDALLILARGLGVLRIVSNLLHAYDVSGNHLILVVGADERENGWIGETMAEHATLSNMSAMTATTTTGTSEQPSAPEVKARGLVVVNTDMMSIKARSKMYKTGGIFSITSRILIVDFLSGLLDPAKVTGIVVLHAERVVETSLEAFILRIYRQKNDAGFIKAFSDSPEPFTMGFSPLEKMLKNLQLSTTMLYPRFQVTVAKSLEGRQKAEVVELEIEMTDAMQAIQIAIMECISVSISELKKANPGLDVEGWTLDAALHKSFDVIVRRQLEPVWHRTTFRTRQMVRDLVLLRTMLGALLSYDCVTFNKYLDTIRAASAPPPGSTRFTHAPWILLDAAESIFTLARGRVYKGYLATDVPLEEQTDFTPVLEEQPKWALLAEIMDEIDQHLLVNTAPGLASSNKTTLIMCSERATCAQIREYLQTMHIASQFLDQSDDDGEKTEGRNDPVDQSGQILLKRKLRNYAEWKRDFLKFSASVLADPKANSNQGGGAGGRAPPNKRRRVRGSSMAASHPGRNTAGGPEDSATLLNTHIAGDKEAHMSRILADLRQGEIDQAVNNVFLDDTGGGETAYPEWEDHFELFDMDDLVLVHPYDGDLDEHLLEETKPTYIILYEPNAAFIRRVEAYRSSHPDRPVRVYFMYYKHSVEEQRYLSIVRKEKDAFTRLIEERGNMALSVDKKVKLPSVEDGFLRSLNTRIAGGGLTGPAGTAPERRRIIVDVREFRSSLPSLIHARSIEIVPAMLTVGDYILSPNLCVERKSVRDLISSLNNGRIYNQAAAMVRYYRHAILLIEFDQDKAFTLEMFADLNLGPNSGGGAVNAASHARSSGMVGGSGSGGDKAAAADTDLQSKLVMLTLAFPGLRIVWTSSPHQSAELFDEMKRPEKEPDAGKCVEIGTEEVGEDGDGNGGGGGIGDGIGRGLYAQVPGEMIMGIPGVRLSTAKKIQDRVTNVVELVNMEEGELVGIVGAEAARQMVRFFERRVVDE